MIRNAPPLMALSGKNNPPLQAPRQSRPARCSRQQINQARRPTRPGRPALLRRTRPSVWRRSVTAGQGRAARPGPAPGRTPLGTAPGPGRTPPGPWIRAGSTGPAGAAPALRAGGRDACSGRPRRVWRQRWLRRLGRPARDTGAKTATAGAGAGQWFGNQVGCRVGGWVGGGGEGCRLSASGASPFMVNPSLSC